MFHYKIFALFICQVDINYVLEELDSEFRSEIDKLGGNIHLIAKVCSEFSYLQQHTHTIHILEAKLFFSPLWSDL